MRARIAKCKWHTIALFTEGIMVRVATFTYDNLSFS